MIMRMIMLKMLMRLHRLLTPEEGLELTNCLRFKPRLPGNIASRSLFLMILVAMLSLIHFIFNSNFNFSSTTWNITGSLIVQKEFLESDMACTKGRTLIIPVRLGHLLVIKINDLNALANKHLDQVPDVQWRDGHLRRAWWAGELSGQLQILWWVRIKPRWKTKSIIPLNLELNASTVNDFQSQVHQNESQVMTQNSLLIFARYRLFHEKAKKSAAVEKFCAHGGRYIFWLPYRFEVSITIDF